ncbi:MAG: VWA domain-containing protein [Chitinophagaceae bacterium]|nr:VWA domain-containing protein [Chitinophagaceae bacterium]
MSFQFQHKEFIWLFAALLLLVALFIGLSTWKKKVTKRIGDPKLVKALNGNFSLKLFTVKFIFFSAAFALGIVAVMNPRKPGASSNITRKGIDVAIAIDVSNSMLAADLAPNRLERAKQFVNKLMNEMPDDRIALVLFAGKAYLQMPLTLDHGAARMFVSTASPVAVPQQGTVITDALMMSANVFNSTEKRFKTVILISDGEEHEESAVKAAAELAEQGVMINTIGVGSPDGTEIIDPATGFAKKDEAGNTVISKLNEETLKQIAAETNGIYIRLQSSDEAVSVIKGQLAQIDKKAFGDVSQINFRTWYFWFAAGMLLLLIIETFIPERRRLMQNMQA